MCKLSIDFTRVFTIRTGINLMNHFNSSNYSKLNERTETKNIESVFAILFSRVIEHSSMMRKTKQHNSYFIELININQMEMSNWVPLWLRNSFIKFIYFKQQQKWSSSLVYQFYFVFWQIGQYNSNLISKKWREFFPTNFFLRIPIIFCMAENFREFKCVIWSTCVVVQIIGLFMWLSSDLLYIFADRKRQRF